MMNHFRIIHFRISRQGTRALRIAFLLTISALVASACSSSGPVEAADMWARPTAPDVVNAAFYGTLTNNTDEVVSFDDGYSRMCDRIEIHRSSEVDGVMTMAPADAVDTQIGPGESMTLEPMGLHVMCVGLIEPLVEGTPVSLEFTFAETGAFVTEVVIEQR